MISTDLITLYWVQGYRPEIRAKADAIAKQVQVHSRKVTPDTILDAFRPNETDEHKRYRKANYKPRTYGWFNKVLQQFVKIRRAEDWRVEWPTMSNNPLRTYTQEAFGEYTTFENWYFGFYLRNVIDDPNGALIFLPSNIEGLLTGAERLDPTQNFAPKPYYFPSSAVRDYNQKLLVIDAQEIDRDALGMPRRGLTRQVMYFFDADEAVKIVQTGNAQAPTYSLYRYTHRLGFTAMLNGGLVQEDNQQEGRTLYDSFIGPALPFWEDAIAIHSDHKVNLAVHIHPDRYEQTNTECTNVVMGQKCSGGKIKMRLGGRVQETDCSVCGGSGMVSPRSPLGVMKIKPVQVGMGKTEFPPAPYAGYIERPVETIKTVKELADEEIYNGLVALNLENLYQTPLNISGVAKDMDRQEGETYVTLVSDWSVEQILKNGYYFMARWFFPGSSDEQLKKYVPSINKPRKFDLVTTDIWAARVATYKKDGAAAAAQKAAEIKLAERQYGNDSAAFMEIRDSILLDPLYGQTADQKNLAYLGGGCTREAYIISNQITYFITEAVIDNPDFYTWKFKDKKALMMEYAQQTLAPAGGLSGALGGASSDPAGGADDPTANLRGSVGGSGIIRQLRVDVAQGLATKEAAIFQIVKQLGYTTEEAAQLIGDPVDLKKDIKSGEVTPAAAAGAAA